VAVAQYPIHYKLQTMVKELNWLYRREPALMKWTTPTGFDGSICDLNIDHHFYCACVTPCVRL
jgi:hypothetical protein